MTEQERLQVCLVRTVARMSKIERDQFFVSYARGRTQAQVDLLREKARAEWQALKGRAA